jgi:hypothetical protein
MKTTLSKSEVGLCQRALMTYAVQLDAWANKAQFSNEAAEYRRQRDEAVALFDALTEGRWSPDNGGTAFSAMRRKITA